MTHLQRSVSVARLAIASIVALLGPARATADLPTSREFTNSLGMKFVRIEPGEFMRGSGERPPQSMDELKWRDWDESPTHAVTISRAFYLGTFEVSIAQYERFDPEFKQFRGRHGVGRDDDDPVCQVTWQQASDFCRWLSQREGLPYRLPTEAEWEYACRAGTTTAFSTGDVLTAAQANIGRTPDGKPRPSSLHVGSFAPNAWGLHDMHGNVAEWCADWYGPYVAGAQTNPTGRAAGHARVVRGWSYLNPSYQDPTRFCRSANRSGHLPEDANRYTGFRVALGELPATKPLPVDELPLYQREVKQSPAVVTGPDPSKLFFTNYVKAGRQPTIPKNTWGPIFDKWNHFAAVCVCPNGDILAVWYTTAGEADRGLAQAASRLRAGSDRWEPASLFFSVPDVNCHAPVLLRDGTRLYHFCTQSLHGWDYAANIVRVSDDSGATWSAPQIIVPRDATQALSQPCSALIAAGGEIVLACDGNSHKDERLVVSRDHGATWKVAGGDMRKTVGAYAIHPALVEAKPGELLCFLRGPNPMPRLVSKDWGETWHVELSRLPGIGVGQKAAALRLASGGILLCSIDSTKSLVGGGAFAAISTDGGASWSHVRKLDGASGYMSATQASDGTVYVFGSRMGCVAFNEAWLKARD